MIKKNNNKKKDFLLISILVFITALLITIGYSAYSSDLMISNAIATIRVDKNVRVTGVAISSTANGGAITGATYSSEQIGADIRMPQSNSSVTFEVEVKNYGNVEMGIESISLPSSLQNIFDVTVTDYILGDKLRDNSDSCESSVDGCKLSINRTFYVTLTYKNGAYNSNNYIFNNIVLDFEFKEVHKVTYTGFTVMHPTLQMKSVMDGHTYSYSIGPYDTLLVKMGGNIITNYTIGANNLLTIPNVTDDLEIIISEVLLDFKIYASESGATFDYTVNGTPYSVYGSIDTQIAIGSQVTVTVSKLNFRTVSKNYTINNNITDIIQLDPVFYLFIQTDLNDAQIAYSVGGDPKTPVTKTLSAEYDPGTVVDITITRPNYRTEVRHFTMNQDWSENIRMVRQYKYKAIARTPAVQNITLTKNGSTETIQSNTEYLIDENTQISVVASASGYRTKTIPHTMTQDFTDTIDLTKTYIYTVNLIKPSGAIMYLTVNNGNRYQVTHGYSIELDVGSTTLLEASATNHKSESYSRTINGDTTVDVNLTRLYTYAVNCSNKSDATVKITYDGQDYTGSGSKSITVEENKSVSWEIKRDYYKTQSGSTSSVTSDVTQNKTLALKDSVTLSNQRQDAIGLGDNASYTVSVPSDGKIISGSLSGTTRASVTNQNFNVVTSAATGGQLWSVSKKQKLTSYQSISASYSCANYTTNIEGCPSGTVTTNMTKGSAVIIHIENAVKTSITYIPK